MGAEKDGEWLVEKTGGMEWTLSGFACGEVWEGEGGKGGERVGGGVSWASKETGVS